MVAWVGMAPEVWQGVKDVMGNFQFVREVVLVPQSAWDAGVQATRVQPAAPTSPGGTAGAAPPVRALFALELGQVGSIRRVCRLRLGLPADDRAGAAPVATSSTVGATSVPGYVPASVVTRKVKMSSIFDQADDTEIVPWTAARMRTVMAAFKAANDDESPDPDEEVSVDQLAALEFKLATGAAPCPDFGVWRPFGTRMARALKLVAHHLTPGGDYVPYEVPGPPDFAAWQAAFRVFSTAMRALGAATQTRLTIYAKKIEKFNETYGALCWWLIAQADQRMRSEQMERIRRRLELEKQTATAAGSTHPLDDTVPWDLCFKEAAGDARYWDEELHAKAVLYITHIKSKHQLTDPGHGLGAQNSGPSGLAGGSQSHQGEGQHAKRKKQSHGGRGGRGSGHKSDSRSASQAPSGSSKGYGKNKGKAKQVDGRFRVDASGNEICWSWNKSESGCAEVCAAGRAHVCEWCRSSKHRSFQCPQKPPGWQPGSS